MTFNAHEVCQVPVVQLMISSPAGKAWTCEIVMLSGFDWLDVTAGLVRLLRPGTELEAYVRGSRESDEYGFGNAWRYVVKRQRSNKNIGVAVHG